MNFECDSVSRVEIRVYEALNRFLWSFWSVAFIFCNIFANLCTVLAERLSYEWSADGLAY